MTKNNYFRVSIDMGGDRGRRLDIIASARQVSRCEVLAMLIDEAFARSLSYRNKPRRKIEKEIDDTVN